VACNSFGQPLPKATGREEALKKDDTHFISKRNEACCVVRLKKQLCSAAGDQ